MTETASRVIGEEEATAYRSQFPIFEHTNYLNSCSLGPPSRDVKAALQRYHDDWSRYGAPAWWKCWLDQLNAAKERFARLIGAGVHEVTISHSISSALSSIASTFDYSARSNVVCASLDFPTIPYQWLAKARDNVQVRVAHSADRIRVPLEAYRDLVDSETALIATSHGLFTSGYIQPIRELAEIAHGKGARLVVDGYHAVGVHPVDVKALEVDFYVGGTLKWLLGGPGLTFIYVREELLPDLRPAITGWFAAADQFAFDASTLDWPPTADRMELGTPAVATAYAGVVGMDMILAADPQLIHDRLKMLTQRLVDRAYRDGYGVISPENPDERGGIVMLEVKRPKQTVDELWNRGITVDYRPGLIRVSPHFFNTIDDTDQFMDTLAELQS